MVEFRVLGALNLLGAGGHELKSVLAQPKRVALLAYLATATPRRLHRRDSLLALFWPELDQEHARAALRQDARSFSLCSRAIWAYIASGARSI